MTEPKTFVSRSLGGVLPWGADLVRDRFNPTQEQRDDVWVRIVQEITTASSSKGQNLHDVADVEPSGEPDI
jgi:hypothetical protein